MWTRRHIQKQNSNFLTEFAVIVALKSKLTLKLLLCLGMQRMGSLLSDLLPLLLCILALPYLTRPILRPKAGGIPGDSHFSSMENVPY